MQFIEIKGKNCDAGITVVGGMILLATISMAIISVQLAYAQNVNRTNKEANNQTSVVAGEGTINLKLGNKTYPIKYHLTGGKLTAITAENDNITLLLNITSTSNGKLTIELPRYVIDSKKQGNVDDNFTVFEDGQYTAANEIKNNSNVRTLTVGFDNGTSVIEITGTHMVPEFTSWAITIFATSIVCVIVASSKYSGITSLIQKKD